MIAFAKTADQAVIRVSPSEFLMALLNVSHDNEHWPTEELSGVLSSYLEIFWSVDKSVLEIK